MQLKVILNHIQKQRFFVFEDIHLRKSGQDAVVEVDIHSRANSKPFCPQCMRRRPTYDRLPIRRYEFIPLWNIAVFFLYARRRVNCPTCGVLAEYIPWATGKSTVTTTYAWFLAAWAKRMSWTEVANAFKTSWGIVFRSVEMAVSWGKSHVDLSGIRAIGVDEISRRKGHVYLTLVYQIDEGCRRLLWIGRERKAETLREFFDWFGAKRSQKLQFISSDMWKPYLKIISEKASQAIHVLDRFHILMHMNKALDKVRAEEARRLLEKGIPILKGTRWCFLKNVENLTEAQLGKLCNLYRYNLKTFKSYLFKEQFQDFWTYVSPFWANSFLETWCKAVMRTRIQPMKKVAKMLRAHQPLILNWFHAKGEISQGAVEGFNNKAKVITKRSYGFRTDNVAEIALFHGLGKLPEPNFTHKFW